MPAKNTVLAKTTVGRFAVLAAAIVGVGAGCPGTRPTVPGPNGPVATGSPVVEIQHLPVVARSNEQVTFTATLRAAGDGPTRIEIQVNAAVVQTCPALSTGDTCTFTGGPYPDYENTTVSYLATAVDTDGSTDTRGHYFFAITETDYSWAMNYLPARIAGAPGDKIDLVLHRDGSYASIADLVSDVGDKMWNVYGEQALLETPSNFDRFNFYIYPRVAALGSSCGRVDSNANTDIPFRDVDGVLHTNDIGDCTVGTHFTAEGHNTKAFLHESGHAVFNVADEYHANVCRTAYFESDVEPNIFRLKETCQAEQTAKGRAPGKCHQFTSCSGGWWGIHRLTDQTVMIRGLARDPWGVESTEKVNQILGQFQ